MLLYSFLASLQNGGWMQFEDAVVTAKPQEVQLGKIGMETLLSSVLTCLLDEVLSVLVLGAAKGGKIKCYKYGFQDICIMTKN